MIGSSAHNIRAKLIMKHVYFDRLFIIAVTGVGGSLIRMLLDLSHSLHLSRLGFHPI